MMSNTTAVFDEDAYIAGVLGPQMMPLRTLLPLTLIYSAIFVSGVVGNVCTCVVISRNQYMQTPTNCYLFNLAIADMLTLLLAMPPELYTLWHQYPWQLGGALCWLRGLIPEATAYASILTIVTFSVERYVAICTPLHATRRSNLTKAVRNIGVIWVCATLCAMPYAFYTQVNHLEYPAGVPLQGSRWCGFPFNKPVSNWEVLMLLSTLLFFVIPLTLIGLLYALIAHALHASSQQQLQHERSKAHSRRTVVRMLAAVVVAFFVCWAPFHAQRLLFLYVSLKGQWTDSTKKINDGLFTIAGCFYYFNSTVNPLLYSVMSRRFRVAFREKLCSEPPSLWCVCCCCFCCVRDFEKRSTQMHTHTQQRRNSVSHSSVRSSHHNNNQIVQVDFDQKLSLVTASCVESPKRSNELIAPEDAIDELELKEELERAIRPELERLEGERSSDCCSNCSLLFPPRPTAKPEERTTTTELESSEQEKEVVKESLV